VRLLHDKIKKKKKKKRTKEDGEKSGIRPIISEKPKLEEESLTLLERNSS